MDVDYSDKATSDEYEFRFVTLPPSLVHRLPRDSKGYLPMNEAEWRSLGIVMSHGWVNYAANNNGPANLLLFAREIDYIKNFGNNEVTLDKRKVCQIAPEAKTSKRVKISPRPLAAVETAPCTTAEIKSAVRSHRKSADTKFYGQSCAPSVRDIFTDFEYRGRGAYGKVFRVTFQGTSYALKEFTSKYFDALAELEAEINATSKLDHPNIVQYIVGFRTDSVVYGLQQFLDGEELGKAAREMTMEERLALFPSIATTLFDALSYMHSRNVVHRDIKADNLFLLQPSNTPMIIDFGYNCINSCQEANYDRFFPYRHPYVSDSTIHELEAYKYNDVYAMGITLREFLLGCYRPMPDSWTLLRLWQANRIAKYADGVFVEGIRQTLRNEMAEESKSQGLTQNHQARVVAYLDIIFMCIGLSMRVSKIAANKMNDVSAAELLSVCKQLTTIE